MTEKTISERQEKSSSANARKRKIRIPLRITDTTLRDAHQSLWATRMRTSDIVEIMDVVDSAGFYSLEVWGGATFDVCLRYLRENPWERLRQIKAKAKKTPLQMLLRGQNIVGYKNYPDDLLDRFVAMACENGIDIFRIFDALNDTRNLEQAIRAVKRHGRHAQGTLCYTTSPVHTVEEYVRIAREQAALGIDSLCVKDMAGILSPISAEKLISALAKNIDVPIQMHCHTTSGMAIATYVEGVRAGAGAIDCAISAMSGFSSLPPVETMLAIFDETSYHARLDIDALRKMCKYFLSLAPSRCLSHHPDNIIDPEILVHHIPGGMISNLRSQLEQQGALSRLGEVMEEIPRTREDLGCPPLVTPTSQIVGVQAVMNVLSGERYSMAPEETKNYVKGLYGRSPAPIKPTVKSKILGDEQPITCRPADILEPMLPRATHDVDPNLIRNEEDIISYCLFPEPALEFFRWRNLSPSERPPIPADIERERRETLGESQPPPTPFLAVRDYEELQALLDKVHQLRFNEVTIRRNDLTLSLRASGVVVDGKSEAETAAATAVPAVAPAHVSDAQNTVAETPKPTEKAAAPESATDRKETPNGTAIEAPLNGTFYTSSGPGQPNFVKQGDEVKAGAPVCAVEAMKLFNQIKAPCDCRIVKFLVEHGQPVEKGQALIAIEKK